MEHYKMSIIIPTYNDVEALDMTIQCILKSDFKDYEILICDDGSNVDNLSIVSKYEYPIRYFYQSDKGFRAAAARNMGILNAKGDICIFVDAGVLLQRHTLSSFYQNIIETHYAYIGYVYGFTNEYEEKIKDLIDINDIDKSIEKMTQHQYFDRRKAGYQALGNDLTTWPAPWIYFSTCLVAVERKLLLDIGMFDENFNEWGCEDSELGLRIFLNGTRIQLDSNAVAIHYPHQKKK
ncbi:MAG: glycosyltransferase [Erysipelotrichaceae bacterium]|nr:glycosyltransferase [Erysipelotrichaceae bacterium]